MAAQYERQFEALTADQGWQVTRLSYPTELAFLVRK
jgi:hypothetical protein